MDIGNEFIQVPKAAWRDYITLGRTALTDPHSTLGGLGASLRFSFNYESGPINLYALIIERYVKRRPPLSPVSDSFIVL